MYLSDILAAVPETVEATAETTLSIGERVSKGLGTSLLGMATIFVMLTVLFIMMKLMSAVFGKNDKKAEKSVPAALPEKAPAPVTVQTEAEDEGETVAAIVAAISACTGSSPASFRVVSFKRVYFN